MILKEIIILPYGYMGTKKGNRRKGSVAGARLAYDAVKKKKKGSWVAAVSKARKALGITGFVPVKKGTALYKKAKALQGK